MNMTEPMTNTALNFICFQLTGPICSTAAVRAESPGQEASLALGPGSKELVPGSALPKARNGDGAPAPQLAQG